MLRLTVILFFVLVLSTCKPPPRSGSTTVLTNTGTSTAGVSPPQDSTSPSPEQSTHSTVYIFKYTGRRVGSIYQSSFSLMAQQLHRVNVQPTEFIEEYDWTDGKHYEGEEDGDPTGDIYVFAIHSKDLDSSKRAGFCPCTLDRAKKICVPPSDISDSACR